MTVETRTFIDLADFAALRFACRSCGEKTSARLLAESKFLSYPEGFTCPHCSKPWFEGPHDKRLEAVVVFLDRFQQLRETKMPFHLEIEVNDSMR